MQQAIEDLPVILGNPNGIIQQQTEFGDVTDSTEISVERMQFTAGTHITPLLEGCKPT